MEKYLDIILSLKNNDLDNVQSLLGLLNHKTNINIIAQTNYLDLMEKKTSDYFFKLFVLENDRWDFFDYGYLKNNCFYAYQSKLLIFNINNIVLQMMRKPNTSNQIIVVTDKSYLLLTPYSQIVNMIFSSKIYNQ